jgi:hypothetical protein
MLMMMLDGDGSESCLDFVSMKLITIVVRLCYVGDG